MGFFTIAEHTKIRFFILIDKERGMKPIKIIAIILVVTIPLTLAVDAYGGLWTDIKTGFKKFYGKFKKDTQTAGETIKKDSGKIGKDMSRDARKAGAEIKASSKQMGRNISEEAKGATKELKNAFEEVKEKFK